MSKYQCKQNDNVIKIKHDFQGNLDELSFGDQFGIDGFVVIGFKDLKDALKIHGFKIVRDE